MPLTFMYRTADIYELPESEDISAVRYTYLNGIVAYFFMGGGGANKNSGRLKRHIKMKLKKSI